MNGPAVSLPSMAVPDGTLLVLTGREAMARENDLIALHDEVTGPGDADFARRLGVWRRQPGFILVEARHGGYPLAYACGLPLRPSTDWWRALTSPAPAAITAEHPGRTFALTQLLVRASWRRQGIATELHQLILNDRGEDRATVKLPPGAAAAQSAFRSWGWTRVARTHGPGPSAAQPAAAPSGSASVLDVLIRTLTSSAR